MRKEGLLDRFNGPAIPMEAVKRENPSIGSVRILRCGPSGETAVPAVPSSCLELWYCRSGRMLCRLSPTAALCLGPGEMVLRWGGQGGASAAPLFPEECEGRVLLLPSPNLPSAFPTHPSGWARLLPEPGLEQAVAALDPAAGSQPREGGDQLARLAGLLSRPGLRLAPDGGCPPAHLQLAQEVCRYLLARMDLHITIPQLSQRFHTSPTQIKLCFRQAYGAPLFHYIREQKMRHAAHQLRTSHRGILEIAGDYGYDNGGKFAAAFRQVMGVSPSQYRGAALQNDDRERHRL